MKREKKKPQRSLRTISREEPTRDEMLEMLRESWRGSDLMAAIIPCVHLQDAIAQLIIAHFPRTDKDVIEGLYERDGPLSTFFSQIQLGYAMGLFDRDVKRDLDTIRHIRNGFAHSLKPLRFTTPEVEREVRRIKSGVATRTLVGVPKPTESRSCYLVSVSNLATHFWRLTTERHDLAIQNMKRRMRSASRSKTKAALAPQLPFPKKS
ncbi:MAG: MltR family transcriptional regulator [Methyloceanibacter sp.]